MKFIDTIAKASGKAVVALAEKNLRVRDILTADAFYNAIVIHGAVGGSTNALLHLPAIAHEAGIELDMELFDRLHRDIPFWRIPVRSENTRRKCCGMPAVFRPSC